MIMRTEDEEDGKKENSKEENVIEFQNKCGRYTKSISVKQR